MALPPPTLDSAVLVTGASSGIGAELARELAGRGHNVVLAARRADRLAALAEELRLAHGVRAEPAAVDLADATARDALAEGLLGGELEIVGVCNNAGFGSTGAFHSLDRAREVEQVRVNVEALHALTGAFLPRMVSHGIGAVLNVASVAGFQPVPGMATYAATKAFVIAFSEAVHTELEGTGVSVTCVCPGPVPTEFGDVAGFTVGGPRAVDARTVARDAVAAMVEGRRALVPGRANRLVAAGGRVVPRSVYLPLARRFGRGR